MLFRSSLFELAEKINRGSAYFGAKARALSKGMSEQQAVQEGINMARGKWDGNWTLVHQTGDELSWGGIRIYRKIS